LKFKIEKLIALVDLRTMMRVDWRTIENSLTYISIFFENDVECRIHDLECGLTIKCPKKSDRIWSSSPKINGCSLSQGLKNFMSIYIHDCFNNPI